MKVIIAPPKEGKGHSFSSELLAWVEARSLAYSQNASRPVWALFGGSSNEMAAFTANLRMGRKATTVGSKRDLTEYEFLRSAGYAYRTQKNVHGTFLTVYLPEYYNLDPGLVDPKDIQFCVLPSAAWLDQNRSTNEAQLQEHVQRTVNLDALAMRNVEDYARFVHIAPLFAAYLDRRTRCPLVADPKFHYQLLLTCIGHRIVRVHHDSHNSDYTENGIHGVGYSDGLCFSCSHATFEQVLAEETTKFFANCS